MDLTDSPTVNRRMVQSVRGSSFTVALAPEALVAIQAGTLRARYRGRLFRKNPFDMAIYTQLLESLRPATIVEFGSLEGGCALWFRDQCLVLNLDCVLHSIDLQPPQADLAGIAFHAGDARNPEGTFPSEVLSAAPHPWLVVEDSAHTYEACRTVLDYFDQRLESGDYIVIEDGVVAELPGPQYAAYEDGPNRAVAEFLDTQGGRYVIDEDCCDFYGHNVTFCPNGWLRRA